jgi:murein DD-endopeptidase MepM/ murein hydrolase activator NlpD
LKILLIAKLKAAIGRSEPWLHRGVALTLFAVMSGALAHAATEGGEVFVPPVIVSVAPPAAAPEPVLAPVKVWNGADIDGDGEADFANPTGGEPRGHDRFGDGEFGSSRDGGSRRHEGVDYVARPGQDVTAPISGYVTKIGRAYENDRRLTFVEITNPALGYVARAFYVAPEVHEGDAVQLGQPIGLAENLQRRYRGITDHVHLELIRDGRRIDASSMISQRVEMLAQN